MQVFTIVRTVKELTKVWWQSVVGWSWNNYFMLAGKEAYFIDIYRVLEKFLSSSFCLCVCLPADTWPTQSSPPCALLSSPWSTAPPASSRSATPTATNTSPWRSGPHASASRSVSINRIDGDNHPKTFLKICLLTLIDNYFGRWWVSLISSKQKSKTTKIKILLSQLVKCEYLLVFLLLYGSEQNSSGVWT